MNNKLLIGIKEYNEADFTHCLTALHAQNIEFDWFVVHKQPNKLAHQLVYATFVIQRKEYMGFVVCDADMCLYPHILQQWQAKMQNDPKISIIRAVLHDYLTNDNMPGVSCYANNCQFIDYADSLIPDVDPSHPGRNEYEYEPAGTHMAHCDIYQAYRFGMHRMTKILQADRETPDLTASMVEWTILIRVYLAYKADPNELRLFALMGALDVFNAKGDNLKHIYDYNYPEVAQMRVPELCDFPRERLTGLVHQHYQNMIMMAFQIGVKLNNPPAFKPNTTSRAPRPFELPEHLLPKIRAKHELKNYTRP